MLRVIVLGAAAGGGVPQWNCGCRICQAARKMPALQGSQASIAVSVDDEHWFLINASPDLRQQLIANPSLHPKAGQLRHSPIAGVILTNGEVDAVAGLLSMREGSPFNLYAHPRVLAILQANSIFNVLAEKNVHRQSLAIDKGFEPTLPNGAPSGLAVLPFAVPGKSAWYLEGHAHPAGGIAQAIELVRGHAPYPLTIEVETESLGQVQDALVHGADIIMLDNMKPEMMTEAVKMIRATSDRVKIEASGNVTLETLQSIAKTGVDYISSSAPMTRSTWMDISMRF